MHVPTQQNNTGKMLHKAMVHCYFADSKNAVTVWRDACPYEKKRKINLSSEIDQCSLF